jgi:hypothetical protein
MNTASPRTGHPARPTRGLVYLLHFAQVYVPYPGAPAYACAGHYTGKPESSGFLNGSKLVSRGISALTV